MPVHHDLAASALTDLLFEEAGIGRCLVAPDGSILRANAEWLRSTGFGLDEVLGADVIALFPETRDMALALHARARAGHRVEVPRHAQQVNGRDTWWEGSIAPFPMEGGTGLLITAREVTAHVLRAPAERPRGAIEAGPDGERPAARERASLEAERRTATLLKAVAETIPDPVFVKDTACRLLFVNPATLRAMGKQPDQVIGKTDREIYDDPEIGAAIAETDRRIMDSGEAVAVEERIQTPDGYRSFLSTKAPLRDDAGTVVGLVGVARDITARKRAEEALRESEERYRLLFRHMLGGVAYCRMIFDGGGRPEDFVYLEVNDTFGALTGLRDVVGKRASEVFPGLREAHPELLEIYGRVARTGQPARFETAFRPLAMSLSVSVYGPHPDHFVAIFDDITERRRTEEALRRYQLLADNSRDVMLFVRCDDGRILDANAAAIAAYGYGREELRALTIRELRAPETRNLTDRLIEEAFSQGLRFETVHRRKDGTTFEVEVCSQGALIDGARTLVSVVRDITQRRRAEEALRESEERLRLFVDHAPAAVAMFDREMRYLAASRRFVSDYRLGERDLVGRNHYDIFPELPERWKEVHRRCLAGAIERCEEEPFPRADGTVDWIRWEIRPWRDAGGGIGGVILFSEIVTERKQAVDKLAAERAQLAVTLASIGDAVIATDEASRVTIMNEVAERLTGWSAADASGRAVTEVFDVGGADDPAVGGVERVSRAGAVLGVAGDAALVARDGTERPIAASLAPIRDARGHVSGIVLVFRDRTEEQRAEADLRRSRRELHELVEKLPIGVFVGRGGRIVYANPTLAGYLGYRFPADLVGKSPEDVLAPGTDGVVVRHVHAESGPHQPIPGREWRFVRPDGRTVTLESAATREIEFEGLPAILYAVRDVTELKQMQAQLMQADRMASVGMLAAGVAHEINNPLAYLISALDVMDEATRELEGPAAGERLAELARALAEARQGADRVKHVVRDLKTFSRAEAENHSTLELPAVIESSISMVWNELRHRARLVKDLRPSPPVAGNEARLGQVFLNLLINAVQAIPEGRADENEIRVSTGTDELGRAIAEVRDSGTGIAPELLERIFDPFFTTKPVGVGTGLGLAICRNLVRAMGGDITVESRPGEGSLFRLTLPAAPKAPVVTAPPPAVSAAPGRRGRVLVVDDELAVAKAVRRILAKEHEVLLLTSARDALAKVAGGERFDAIVCDLMMPAMTGMDLHAELSSIAPEQAERMILVSGGAFTPRATAFLSSVPNPRVEKPFDPVKLRAHVRALVG